MSRSTLPFAVVATTALLSSFLTPALFAQEASPPRTSADSFLERHPGAWRVAPEAVTRQPTFVYGDRLALPVAPRTDVQYEAAARYVVDANPELFGAPSTQFTLREVVPLALSRVGSSDKVAVVLDQSVDGVPVWNGSVTVLFERASGDVLALDTTALPFADRADANPTSAGSDVIAAARAAFAAHFGITPTEVQDMRPAIVGPSSYFGDKNALTERGPTLAWVLDLAAPGRVTADRLPAQGRVLVSAEGDLTVFDVTPTAHAIDGQVEGHTNVGPEPNTPSNQELVSLANLWVRQNNAAGAILATTDANGDFSMGQAGPLTLFFQLRGPYVLVDNQGSTDASFTVSNATNGSPVNVLFNPAKTEHTTAEVAGAYWVNAFRDFVKATDPADAHMDFQVLTEVNKSDLVCNAYYDGTAINMQIASGNCTNTAYMDVILHEEGHWANEVYNGGSGMTSAFHEGNADNWAYSIGKDPCLTSFTGPGCLRTALQTSVKKCPNDGDVSCHGGSGHTEGQALASAVWSVRSRLRVSQGQPAGDALTDALFLGWMQAFNDKNLLNVISDHWLVLDDDNGNLGDLTPHFGEINGGFQDYGWPGLPDLSLSLVASPADNQAVGHGAAVPITAQATSLGGSVTGVTIHYAVNNGGFQTAAMSPAGGNQWTASVPGVPSPATVRWYVSATSSIGSNASVPSSAPDGTHVYHVGQVVTLASFDFEAGTDQGWTHVNLSGTNGDQWERGNPVNSNESSDPTAAFSGTRVWGTDLSLTGFDGKYEPNSSGELRSPSFNFSGSSQVRLQYRRWLAVEQGLFDTASIRVNGATVWSNPVANDVLDGAWVLHDLDISAQAAGNPAVQLAWRLASDGGVEFGGWNLDDVLLYRVDPAPGGSFTTYGSGCPGSTGTPTLTGTGTPGPGASVQVLIGGGLPNGPGLLLAGTLQVSVGLPGSCTLLAGGTYLGGGGFPLTLDGAGGLTIPVSIPPAASGVDLYMQWFGFDNGAGNGLYGATNGLRMIVP